jgi:hypothetical protein
MNTTPSTVETTTTTRPWTLADIAESQGVQKRAAQNWLKLAKVEHGDIGELVGKTRYFSLDERDILISYAAPPRPVRVAPLQVEAPPEFIEPPAEYRQVEIVSGNHRATVEAPAIGGQIDLARFRGDIEVRTYEDPLNNAAAAIQLFDALGTAMDADLDRSFAKLETTTATVQQLQERAESMAAKQLEYQVTQKILSRLQNQQTAALSGLLGKAQSLTDGSGQ